MSPAACFSGDERFRGGRPQELGDGRQPARHAVVGDVVAETEPDGGGDLRPSQVSALLRLEKDGPATLSQLARAEGMRPQSMGAAIAPLEAAGLVGGAPDPEDRRQTLLSLTDTCRERLRVRRAAWQDWLSRTIQARLSPKEQDQLAEAVALLRRLADD